VIERIDLNADLGEQETPRGRAAEAALFGVVSSVNIACGGHAGSRDPMSRALDLAARRGLAAGAHPSYPDRAGFGRVRMVMAAEELEASLREQIGMLAAAAAEAGVRLAHVKPHGALYHAASEDEATARAVFDAARAVDPGLRLIGAAGSRALAWWRGFGAVVGAEAFADRGYGADGRLLARGTPGAMIGSVERAAAQAVAIARGVVTAVDGTEVAVDAQTICVHADTPGAVDLAVGVRAALVASGVRVASISGG
jgi:UPF0271 protein